MPDRTSRSFRLATRRPAALLRVAPWSALGTVAATGVLVLTAGCGAASSGAAPPPAAAAGPPSAGPAATAPSAQGSTSAAPSQAAPEVNPAGDIPDSQVFVPFSASDASFTVSVPQGWARSDSGAATLFTDKFNSVRIEQAANPGPVDAASVRAREIPTLATSVPGFVPGDVRPVRRTAGTAIMATYSATSAPNPVTGKSVTEAVERYSFWKSGREVLLTLSGPTGADNVDPWRHVTDSFRWQR